MGEDGEVGAEVDDGWYEDGADVARDGGLHESRVEEAPTAAAAAAAATAPASAYGVLNPIATPVLRPYWLSCVGLLV